MSAPFWGNRGNLFFVHWYLLLLSLLAIPAQAAELDTLTDICKFETANHASEMGFCSGHILGVIAVYNNSNTRQQIFCMPPHIPVGSAVTQVRAFLEAGPDDEDLDAYLGVMSGLAYSYPC